MSASQLDRFLIFKGNFKMAKSEIICIACHDKATIKKLSKESVLDENDMLEIMELMIMGEFDTLKEAKKYILKKKEEIRIKELNDKLISLVTLGT